MFLVCEDVVIDFYFSSFTKISNENTHFCVVTDGIALRGNEVRDVFRAFTAARAAPADGQSRNAQNPAGRGVRFPAASAGSADLVGAEGCGVQVRRR